MTEPLLSVQAVSKRFGGVVANDDISFNVAKGELVSVIGPNGAGKSTLFKVICGIRPPRGRAGPDAGRILFDGRDVTGLPSYQMCRAGLALVFQETESLAGMTALENVAIGALARVNSFHEALRLSGATLETVGLAHRSDDPIGDLTLAERRRLEIGRALATGPKLLLLDETMAGLTPVEVSQSVDLVREIAAHTTVMLIEHVLQAVMAVSDRIIVLDNGRVIADGAPASVVEDPVVVRAYLGGELTDA